MDPELHAVRYAFDASFQRMCEAETDDALMAELSNLLHHLYRLRELCGRRLTGFDTMEKSTADLRAARAAAWVRNADTHHLCTPAAEPVQSVYSDFYTATCGGVQVWKPRSSVPLADDEHGRSKDYKCVLEGEVVLDTLRRAFDAMAGLL